jgi:hypothetical protein
VTWIGLGVVVAIVSIASSSVVGIYFMSPDAILPLVGVLALAFVLRNTRLSSQDNQSAA